MAEQNYDLTVIGSGPGGYVAAIRASQLGMKVAVIEKEEVGGVCLNWGCIPTKALLKSAEMFHSLKRARDFGITAENVSFDFEKVIARSRRVATRLSKGVEYLFKKNQITLLKGHGRILAGNKIAIENGEGSTEKIGSRHTIIATGASPRSIPGIEIDGTHVITSREAMIPETVPESLIVIGAGAIGVEFAYFYNAFGCDVTIVEMMPSLLPIEDAEITKLLNTAFKKNRMKIHTGSMVKSVDVADGRVHVRISNGDEETELNAEKALIAIGVQPNSENLNLESVGIETEKGWIKVDDHFRTNAPGVYAIGDIIGPPWLAHVASAEGINAVEKIAGLNPPPINYSSIPGCTYCQPQVASIGMTEEKAMENGHELKIGRFPFQANGKSLALGENQGIVKLIFDKKTDQLLGAHIIHAEATELINELSVVKHGELTAYDMIKSIHAHPTLSEALMEAAAAAHEEAIHI
ncbi:MAG: dihydrolipoyl dehydrogenase [candidate division KSB1 bacterium]|jgi:dihydrolipoamide dehydrogenase|nr:dihydrolipoyl dehydrogenase [candidate division KSB1 bacterium]